MHIFILDALNLIICTLIWHALIYVPVVLVFLVDLGFHFLFTVRMFSYNGLWGELLVALEGGEGLLIVGAGGGKDYVWK